jgi:hypothetical protein
MQAAGRQVHAAARQQPLCSISAAKGTSSEQGAPSADLPPAAHLPLLPAPAPLLPQRHQLLQHGLQLGSWRRLLLHPLPLPLAAPELRHLR